MAIGTDRMKSRAVNTGKPSMVYDFTRENLIDDGSVVKKVGGAVVSCLRKRYRMVMEVNAILIEIVRFEILCVTVPNFVVTEIAVTWVALVAHVIHDEPIVNPAIPETVGKATAELR